jgi:hypothetical protein
MIPRVLSKTKISGNSTTHNYLIQQFRNEHSNLFPAETPNHPKAKFHDQCAVIFQCTVCRSVFHLKDAGSHGAECPRSSRNSRSIESSVPAQRSIVATVLSLLKIIKLPHDATLSFATEALKDARFACLCGDPRYEGNFDFQGIVGTFNLIATLPTAELVQSFITLFLRIKNTRRLNQRSLGRRGAVQQTTRLSRTLDL